MFRRVLSLFGAGLVLVVSSSAIAQDLTSGKHRPVIRPVPTYPSAPYIIPSTPSYPSMPSVPSMPNVMPTNPSTPFNPMTPTNPTVPNTVDPNGGGNAAVPPVAAAFDPGNSASVDQSSATDTGAGGSAVVMDGRADGGNRFNLFDNMGAIPQNRIWFQYQYIDNYDTFLRRPVFVNGVNRFGNPGVVSNGLVNDRRNLNQYRMGLEIAPTSDFSIALQAMYIQGSSGGVQEVGQFASPEIALKYAIVNTADTVISPTIGFQFNLFDSSNIATEDVFRVIPGFLVYQSLGDNFFFQGGAQVNFPLGSAPSSFDYAATLGTWLYRDESLTTSGRSNGAASSGFLTGVIAQVGILGNHFISGRNQNPYDLQNSTGFSAEDGNVGIRNLGRTDDLYFAPSDVIDATGGMRFLFGRASFNVGVSYPISEFRVRNFELISGINISF